MGFDPEVVAYDPRNQYSSGGGFSNYFARPKYQADTVAGYLDKLGDQFSDLYNASGRAYPDVAAYSVNYTIIWNGTLIRVDGTSAATPTMAAIFSLVNDALLAAGKPVLGWLNPWLYKKGKAAFADVTQGSSLGCNTTGFPAVEGWDAVTGFGTPVSAFSTVPGRVLADAIDSGSRSSWKRSGWIPILVEDDKLLREGMRNDLDC